MTAQTTDISLCSTALSAMGADPIESFSDETREALVCAQFYSILIADLLSRHPWRFAVGQAQLSRLNETPLYGYAYAYQLPTDMVDLLSMERAGGYQVYENKLFSDLPEMKVTYKFQPKESRFPAYFQRLVVLEMAAFLSVAIAEDKEKAKMFQGLAIEQLRQSKLTDSKQQPNRSVRQENFSLIQVRHSY